METHQVQLVQSGRGLESPRIEGGACQPSDCFYKGCCWWQGDEKEGTGDRGGDKGHQRPPPHP